MQSSRSQTSIGCIRFSVNLPKNHRMPSALSNVRGKVSGIAAVCSHDTSTRTH